jgi:hypothetical protein
MPRALVDHLRQAADPVAATALYAARRHPWSSSPRSRRTRSIWRQVASLGEIAELLRDLREASTTCPTCCRCCAPWTPPNRLRAALRRLEPHAAAVRSADQRRSPAPQRACLARPAGLWRRRAGAGGPCAGRRPARTPGPECPGGARRPARPFAGHVRLSATSATQLDEAGKAFKKRYAAGGANSNTSSARACATAPSVN